MPHNAINLVINNNNIGFKKKQVKKSRMWAVLKTPKLKTQLITKFALIVPTIAKKILCFKPIL